MMRKKAKSKRVSKKGKRAATRREPGKHMDPAKVRQDIAGIVKARARAITKAVVEKASHGELAPARYLLEMAGVYPPDGSVAPESEESLAQTLLKKLGIPDDPVIHEMYEKGEDIVIPSRLAVPENQPEEKEEELVKAE